MADQYLGQLLLVPYNFAPAGYAFCQGQLLPISQNTALFSLLGTNFGGNGTSTFALPNLQGCMPIGTGQGPGQPSYFIGQTGGETSVTLLTTQLPTHTHVHQATSTAASSYSPAAAAFAPGGGRGHAVPYYIAAPGSGTLAPLNASSVQATGGSQAHSNLQPYLTLNWVIALQGVYPPRQ
jgi:microcystin-dependent protein